MRPLYLTFLVEQENLLPSNSLATVLQVREKRMIAGIQQLLADCASAVAESKGRVKLPCLHEVMRCVCPPCCY